MTPVLIIGAGPAGLSLAYYLKQRGIDCELLERGDQAGYAFTRMPTHMRLGSWATSRLPGMPTTFLDPFLVATRREFAEALRQLAAASGARIRTQVDVHSVRHSGSEFVLETSKGPLTSRFLVNATGYFSRPLIPSYPGSDTTSIRQMHAAEFRDEPNLPAEAHSILIVGQGLTAGELLVELYDGGRQVALSHRSRLLFGQPVWLQDLVSPLFFLLEAWKIKRQPRLQRSSRRPMDGGRVEGLVRSGRVRQFPSIERFEADRVRFSNGQEATFDLVIYATGYLPALQHLSGLIRIDGESGLPALNDMESADQPGLFFLGLENLYNFRSRFLRGIREDAARLADTLAERMRQEAT